MKMDWCSWDCEWEKCSNKLNQERLFQCFHFMVAFLKKVSIYVFSPAGVMFTRRRFNIHIAVLQNYQSKAS